MQKEDFQILKNFVVFEGIDGSGTSTQLKIIEQRLKKEKKFFFSTAEPTKGKIGNLINSILEADTKVDPKTLALLFSADRSEHLYNPLNGIIRNTEKGKLVICDRYLFSSLAYQSITCGFDFVFSLNKYFPIPEHLIYIDTPVSVCKDRIKDRDHFHIFETTEFQKKVHTSYVKILKHFKNSEMKIHIISGLKNPEQISNHVWEIINSMPIM